MVRVPVDSFNITDDIGASVLSWYTQFVMRMSRLKQSSTRNWNNFERLNDPMNSHFVSNWRRTVHIFDALPPRCQRPYFDLCRNEREKEKCERVWVCGQEEQNRCQRYRSLSCHSNVLMWKSYLRSESSSGKVFTMWMISSTHRPTHAINLSFGSISMLHNVVNHMNFTETVVWRWFVHWFCCFRCFQFLRCASEP